MAAVKKLSDVLKNGLPCYVEVHGSLKQDGISSEEDEEPEDSVRNTLLRFEEELELQRISARVSEFQFPDEFVKLHGKDFVATRSLFVGTRIYLQYAYKGPVRKLNTKAQKSRSFPRRKKSSLSGASGFITLAEIVDRCRLPQTVEFIDIRQQHIAFTGDAETDYNFFLILSGPIELLSVDKQKFYIGVTGNCKTFILPHDKSLLDSIMVKIKTEAEDSNSRISEYKPDRTILEEKVFSDFYGNPRYLELGKAITAESVENPTSSITADSNSIRTKRSPPTFPPPRLPPSRSVKPGKKKSKDKQIEVFQQHSLEKAGTKKKSKGGNFDAKKEDLTGSDSEIIYSEPFFPDEKYHLAVSKTTKVKTKDTTRLEKNLNSKNIYASPNIERKCPIPVAVEEEVKTHTNTKRKVYEPLSSDKDETVITGNIYVPMASFKKETKTTNTITKLTPSGATEAGIKCSVHFKIDFDEDGNKIDDSEYMQMGYVGTEKESANVFSPIARRKAKTSSFKSLSKRELVRRLEECGLQDMAAVCEKEKLDGQFLEDHVSDEDLMREPFCLSRFQIKKLRAVIDGWRPVSEFINCIDSVGD